MRRILRFQPAASASVVCREPADLIHLPTGGRVPELELLLGVLVPGGSLMAAPRRQSYRSRQPRRRAAAGFAAALCATGWQKHAIDRGYCD